MIEAVRLSFICLKTLSREESRDVSCDAPLQSRDVISLL